MAETPTAKLRVFVDADVLFAGAASPQEHSASQVILRLGEITLVDAVTSRQAVVEAERNLEAYMPNALPAFRHLVSRALRSVDDPEVMRCYSMQDLRMQRTCPCWRAHCARTARFSSRSMCEITSPAIRMSRS